MEKEKYIELYKLSNGKEPSKDIIDFFESGEEKPLIYKDGKIQISEGVNNGSKDNR